MCRNVRQYIEREDMPPRCYYNLVTYPQNQDLSDGRTGWYPSNQRGLGAQALVFRKQGVMELLSHRNLVGKVQDARNGHSCLDGKISTTLKKEGYAEYVHNPSLVDHIGQTSSMRSKPQPAILSFPGCDFDVLQPH